MSNGIVVVGPVCQSGYGIVCANVVHALTLLGAKVYYQPWPRNGSTMPMNLSSFADEVCKSVSAAYDRWNKEQPTNATHLHVWHEWQLGGDWNGPTVGMPFFETVPIRKDAILPLKNCTRVVTPCVWATEALAQSGIASTPVVYPGFDPQVFRPLSVPRSSSKFIFLHVGKFEIRKGIDVLLKAFGAIAPRYKNAELWLSVDNPFTHKWYGQMVSMMLDAGLNKASRRVRQVSPRHMHSDMAALYNSVHAVVQPSRGEGFGLPALEALACGIPTAMTWCTGHEAFGPHLNSVRIPHGDLETAADGLFFHGDRKWCAVEVENVAAAMVNLYENRPQPLPATDFTWKAGAERLLEYLNKEGLL